MEEIFIHSAFYTYFLHFENGNASWDKKIMILLQNEDAASNILTINSLVIDANS